MTHALHLTAAVTHEGEWYVARCLQAEVASQGETIEEALSNLREALELQGGFKFPVGVGCR